MRKMIKLAARNLLRYRRRTLLTALLIIIGVVAVLLFVSISGSFKDMMIAQITDSMLGHLQVHRRGYVASIDKPAAEPEHEAAAWWRGSNKTLKRGTGRGRRLVAAHQVRRDVQQFHRDHQHPPQRHRSRDRSWR